MDVYGQVIGSIVFLFAIYVNNVEIMTYLRVHTDALISLSCWEILYGSQQKSKILRDKHVIIT